MTALLVRDVMRIGVPTCRIEEPIRLIAAQMLEKNCSALVVLDEDGDTRGWINERLLAGAYLRQTSPAAEQAELTAGDVMDERVPECPADVPLTAAIQIMADLQVDHLFFLHHAGGRSWPASVLNLRDAVRALAGDDFIKDQGAAAPRPTPMDLFRERYRSPKGKT